MHRSLGGQVLAAVVPWGPKVVPNDSGEPGGQLVGLWAGECTMLDHLENFLWTQWKLVWVSGWLWEGVVVVFLQLPQLSWGFECQKNPVV